ncbi:Kinesin light chain 3 protein [Rutstroemia sp. NJR-2017a BBW]|nr:Kinesin light chain 3 protein [Rutstroemia sp. NJR-2017a BBW]
MFRKVVPQDNTPRLERYRLAVNILANGNRVEILMKGILEDLIKAIEEMSTMLPSLPEDMPGNSIISYGSGTINANTGLRCIYNNTSSGKQFNADNQYFGKQY